MLARVGMRACRHVQSVDCDDSESGASSRLVRRFGGMAAAVALLRRFMTMPASRVARVVGAGPASVRNAMPL
jgi:hypothetical protein